MKTLAISAALFTGMSMAAYGGSLTTPVTVIEDAPPIAANVNDWSGFYLGANVGFAGGTISDTSNVADDLAGNAVFGAFAGYNIQRNNLVFGAELDYTATESNFATFPGNIRNIFDAKGRVGYSIGKVMVYGVAGYSTVTLQEFGDTAPLSGFNYGVGVDAKIGDRFIVGAEYLTRSVSGSFVNQPLIVFSNQNVSTIRLRVGVSF